ncbi:MAG TPA: hypothetical protein VF950_29600 [Planctomycetota bacterium]
MARFAVFLLAGLFPQEGTRSALPPLPEGHAGIAGKYPGDAGIERDPDVVFFEDFEAPALRFDNNWGGINLNPAPENVHGGKRALDVSLPYPRPNKETGKGVAFHLKEGLDTLHLRYYAKYGKNTELYHGATHNGGGIGATAPGVPEAEPGVPADGRRKYGILLDTYRSPDDPKMVSPGPLAVYVYHPEQRHRWGEHFYPTGQQAPYGANPNYFGPRFVKRPDITPALNRWICYELMVQANTPGQRDGRIAFWIDGRLAADFPNLRLRDVATLKSNQFSLGLYTMNDAIKGPCEMWYDDVVAATSYVGPVLKRKKSGPVKSAEEMAKAREAFSRADLAAAWRHLDKVDSEELYAEAQEKARRIEEAVNGRIREAQALEAIGEKTGAIDAYREILKEFAGIPAADRVKARIDALRAPPAASRK